jgi:ATP-dependent RNA helicase RhlE
MLQRLSDGPPRQLRALILVPTRELAEQIHVAIRNLGRNSRLRSATVYGGVSKRDQAALLRRGVEIVVACPGRLLDLIQDGLIDLSFVEMLVLDEADRMCDMGFLPDIRRILTHLPPKRQTLFFSATMPPDIRSMAKNILRNPVSLQAGAAAPVQTVSHCLYPISDSLKAKLLLALLPQVPAGRILIFTRTRRKASNLESSLKKNKYRAASLHGDMAQNRRQSAINGFRGGKYDILVATDIAARGIDVSQISHVINFDMPESADAYTHRIGRTGRAHETGEALTFATPMDQPIVRDIEKVLHARIERRQLPGFEYGEQVQRAPQAHSANPPGAHAQPISRRFRPSQGARQKRMRLAGR